MNYVAPELEVLEVMVEQGFISINLKSLIVNTIIYYFLSLKFRIKASLSARLSGTSTRRQCTNQTAK